MRKIYLKLKSFLKEHYKLGFSITILLLIISAILITYHVPTSFIMGVCVFTFGVAMLRLVTHKNGYIYLSGDSLWYSCKRKYRNEYSEEEIDEKFKELSLRNATVYLMIGIASFIIWLVVELILWIF